MGKYNKKRNNKKNTTDNTEKKDFVRHFKMYRKSQILAFYNRVLNSCFIDETEKKAFNESLFRSLPMAFRVNKSISNSSLVFTKLKEEHSKNKTAVNEFLKDCTDLKPELFEMEQVEWFPRKSLIVMQSPRNLLKKFIPLKPLHKHIQKSSEGGLITRQELVSMLPPLFLDIQPDDKVLDMCAAPGSKTSQLLEELLINCQEQSIKSDTTDPLKEKFKALANAKGAIVANEIDFKRAFILSHQMKRFNSSNVAVINHPGQHIPDMYSNIKEPFYFDKVLVDVPCSGDGAIRKLPMKWKEWSSFDGIGLHYLQLQLLQKSVEVLKQGGLLVYSTCSLNPVENEAVVTEILRQANQDGEMLELIDVHTSLNGFKMRKGMTKWNILLDKPYKKTMLNKFDDQTKFEKETQSMQEAPNLNRFLFVNPKGKEGDFNPVDHEQYFYEYTSFDDYKTQMQDKPLNTKVKESLFALSEDEMVNKIKIERTARVMPHDQDTGGFYIAVIRKKGPVVFSNSFILRAKPEDKEMVVKKEVKGKLKNSLNKRDLMSFNKLADEDWQIIQKEFNLPETFPKHLLVNSSDERARRVNFINQGLYDMLSVANNEPLRKIYFGVPVFARNTSSKTTEGKFRLSYSGLPLIYPYLKDHVVGITFAEFKFLLENPSTMTFDSLEQCKSLYSKVIVLPTSSYCLKMDPSLGEDTISFKEVEFLAIQKMKASVGTMVSREQLDALRTKYSIELK